MLLPFRTFQHLLLPADQRACLERIRAHLLEAMESNFYDDAPDEMVYARSLLMAPLSTWNARQRLWIRNFWQSGSLAMFIQDYVPDDF